MFLNRLVNLPDYVTVTRRKVKWARIEVRPDGQVKMVVPRFMGQGEIESFFQRKYNWVEEKRNLYANRAKRTLDSTRPVLFGDVFAIERNLDLRSTIVCRETRSILSYLDLSEAQEFSKWYRQYSKEYLAKRINEISGRTGLVFNKLYIRDQKTRWGSCSNKKNISLNWRLIKAPESVIDYVIVHELAHTKEMNHSRSFWQLVELHQPGYMVNREWLKQNGHQL